MSLDTYALHAYAVEVQGLPLRDEIKALLNDADDKDGGKYQDIDDVLEDFREGCLEEPVWTELDKHHWEMFYGPCNDVYIGYSAQMPYELPFFTKDEMDKDIYDTLTYLCGEEYAKKNTPDEIFETWTE